MWLEFHFFFLRYSRGFLINICYKIKLTNLYMQNNIKINANLLNNFEEKYFEESTTFFWNTKKCTTLNLLNQSLLLAQPMFQSWEQYSSIMMKETILLDDEFMAVGQASIPYVIGNMCFTYMVLFYFALQRSSLSLGLQNRFRSTVCQVWQLA